jgi:alpha-tubulin suppressor-like RCC1 family protein
MGVAGLAASAALGWSAASAAFSVVSANPTSSLSTGTWPSLDWIGDGQFGQGGIIDLSPDRSPGQESTGSTIWSQVSSGDLSTCGIRTNNTLWCWGDDSRGQLGIGNYTGKPDPTQIAGTIWATVSVGVAHACATRTDGTLWCWGHNDEGEVGNGTVTAQPSPVQIGAGITTWSTVDAGSFHTCATRTDGTLWCWGFNQFGEVGIGSVVTPQTSPVQVGAATTWNGVSAGGYHTCATRTDGTLWCWGNNGNGQVGIGSVASPQSGPVQVGVLTTYTGVTAGYAGTCATRTGNTLWCWGNNAYGQLGIGNTTQQTSPAQVAGTTWASASTGGGSIDVLIHTCATRTDGTLWCWGNNQYGQLGLGTTTQQNSPVQVGALTTWSSVSAGGAHTCAIRGGMVWCWGKGAWGRLGQGTVRQTSTATQVGAVSAWATASSGTGHTCATRTDGTLWCWGDNASGQLGLSSITNQYAPTQVGVVTTWLSVSTGSFHTCATRTNGTLWCWGNNAYGQLGLNSTISQAAPVQVGALTTWRKVAAGQNHTCATKADNSLWCWGNNQYGQIGNGGVVSPQKLPVQVAGTTWNGVSGGNSTCATKTDGTLWCWGLNVDGRLGIGNTTSQSSPVQVGAAITTWSTLSVGGGHACATRTDGTLWCWGLNTSGQVGIGSVVSPQTSPVQVGAATTWNRVAPGNQHTCAARTDNTLWCWGYNAQGQLGLGDTTERDSPVQVPGISFTGGLYAGSEANQTFFVF